MTVLVIVNVPETGAGADLAVLIVQQVATDSGAGDDVVLGGPTTGDSGIGVDAALVMVTPVLEVGVGRDIFSVIFTPSDTAQGTDDASLIQIMSADDSGVGDDSVNNPLLITVADRGLGVDTANSQLLLVVETAVGQDVAIVIQTATDTGSGTDDDLVVSVTAHDFGFGSDEDSPAKGVTETGQGTEVVALRLSAPDDSGAAVDVFKLTIVVIETANANDETTLMVSVDTPPDRIRLLMTSGRVRLKVE